MAFATEVLCVPMRVLLIEDDPEVTRVVVRGLEGEGFSVDAVADGVDGLWQATEGNFDVVVLDLLLPSLSGYRVCESLRERNNATPVVVLTAKSGEYDQIDLLDLGADDFLTKPVSIKVLAARIRAAVRRATGSSTNQLSHGSILFELEGHRCWRDGEEIALTKKESEVLYVLVAAAGSSVSRREIERAAWGVDFEGDPGSVDVYINRLRKKLGSDLIVNTRGVGFHLTSKRVIPRDG